MANLARSKISAIIAPLLINWMRDKEAVDDEQDQEEAEEEENEIESRMAQFQRIYSSLVDQAQGEGRQDAAERATNIFIERLKD